MDSSYRIIISTSSLNIEDWTDLYRFIDSIFTNDTDEKKIEALHDLKEKCVEVRYTNESNSDVYKLDGNELTDNVLKQLSTNTCFSILFQKKDDTEEFTGFAPFALFLHRFKYTTKNGVVLSLVSLGIDTDGMKDQTKANSFRFKFSNFFILYQNINPVLGSKTLYFYSTKNRSTTSLAGKKAGTEYYGDPNRRFLPLLEISEDNYHSIFTASGRTSSKESRDFLYINESLNKIKDDFRNDIFKTDKSKLNLIVNYKDSLFGQWLINGYFYSFEAKELRDMTIEKINGIIQTLQVYKNSIFELIQNIIFHGGKSGLFYCVFDKKENVSSYYQKKLSDFNNEESEVNRFLRIGIYDHHETGIVDSFKENGRTYNNEDLYNNLTLKDFFDPNTIVTLGITRLDMRYAAHLGIKSFVKTVFKHDGYFNVESNEIINGKNVKKRFSSYRKDDHHDFHHELIIDNCAPGTHYEIILPVKPNHTINSPQIQRNSILNFRQTLENQLSNSDPITSLDLDFEKMGMISNCETKQQQINAIINIGDEIIRIAGDNHNEIALNLKGKDFDHKLVFKIISYIQLKADNGFRKIILINGTDDFVSNFCELINPLLTTTDDKVPVWRNDKAIILMSETLHAQIICGETKGELYLLNQEFKKYYCNNFTEKDDLRFSLSKQGSYSSSIENISKDFILPYDILIEFSDGKTPFEAYSLDLLKRKIISDDLGFLVNHENTYIGNKIIVKNYYEADMMFQNSFFAERFAFLIAKNIRRLKRKDDKELVLIGYQQYSEYLLKAIKRIIDDKSVHIAIASSNDEIAKVKSAKDIITKNGRASDETTNEEKHALNIDLSFNFDIDGENIKLRENILSSPEQFQFATIVPIGATLSTNDKIVALFKLWHKLHNSPQRDLTSIDFIYNHCVIIVRDSVEPLLTNLEEEQKWNLIDLYQRIIETKFQNAKEIHYTIQIANALSTESNSRINIACNEIESNQNQREEEKSNSIHAESQNWLKRLNNVVSFPKEWEKEEYVNFTENSSINSQNLMGFPKVDKFCIEAEDKQHILELERLYLLRNDILKGHFVVFNSHLKFFIDTESFVRRENSKKESTFINWISGLKKFLQTPQILNQNKINILITPNAETESDFICIVNDQIFDGNALIVYLNVKNWRNNIIHKLSFLKNMGNNDVSFHYVDHILLTGETYHRTKSYLNSIKGGLDSIKFDSIITIINRLPYPKSKEIRNDTKHFFAFINLYYPTSRLDGRECELCKLKEYYGNLWKETVLDSCKNVINNNVEKIIRKGRRDIDELKNVKNAPKSRRDFLRLVITHELYYIISQIAWGQANFYVLTKDAIIKELDAFYNKLCNKMSIGSINTKSSINEKIEKWFQYRIEDEYIDLRVFLNKKLETDKIISFLKVISSPPLSQYIIIREYAHQKLLSELNEIIHNTNRCSYDDLRIVKSILKSLSFLKSNALVREDVIVGAWNVLGRVIEHLENKAKAEIDDIGKKIDESITKIEAELNELNLKTQLTVSEGERRHYLIITKDQKDKYHEYLIYEKKEIDRLLSSLCDINKSIIRDFSKDIQFYIKNAIVEDDAKATFLGELIRKGTEISSFENISISQTKLSKNTVKNQNEENNLFDRFHDNEYIRKEYIHFLVWLFYDNATIIRKTLANFSMELKKDNSINSLFYIHRNNGEFLIKDIDLFKDDIDVIERKFNEIINNEYYYSSFQPYLYNEDKINYTKKLIYVTYAKLKLEDLIVKKHKTSIESDLRALLKVFSEIMGADGAFITIKNGKKLIPVTLYKKKTENEKDIKNQMKKKNEDNNKHETDIDFDYDSWALQNYYTKRYSNKSNLVYPFNPVFNLRENSFGENSELDAHSINVFIVENQRTKARATITFLYNSSNEIIKEVRDFRINTQESGRLLLLLKNEIQEYVIDYLINEKVFDLWLEKQKSLRKFDKIYIQSNHTFNNVYKEMNEFDNIDTNTIKSLYRTWFLLTNETISFLYSSIERNRLKGKNCLSIKKDRVISKKNTLGKTFNDNFIYLLSCLLDKRWNKKKEHNTIIINNKSINNYSLEKSLRNIEIPFNKHLLRTFIAQCLHNSLAIPIDGHGHRPYNKNKQVEITITESSITIMDKFIDNIPFEDLMIEINSFKTKKHHIQTLNCDEYSSTTLTTLQGVINYMNTNGNPKKDSPYQCDYGFDENNNFFVTIKF